MRTLILAAVVAIGGAGPAFGQSGPVYLGLTTGINGGSRGPVDVGSVRTAGGVVGIRLSDAWSVELEADRGFGSSSREDGDSFWVSYAPPGSSSAEIERLAVRARFRRIDSAGVGFSAHVVWRNRAPGRVSAAIYGGVSQRNFDKRVIRTTTHVPDDPAIPRDDPNVRDDDETRTLTGGGLTAGVLVPVRLTDTLTLAPDVRLTLGVITDESTYRILTAGLRLTWGFRPRSVSPAR